MSRLLARTVSTKALLVSLVVASLLATATISAVETPSASATEAEEPTVSTSLNGKAYDVRVGGQKVTSVPVSDPGYAVRTSISSDGASLALIPDYESTAGASVYVLDIAMGVKRLIDAGRVTSASFSPDTSRLAYVVLAAHGSGELRLSRGTDAGRTFAKVPGRHMKILGWDDAGETVYLVRHPATQSDAQLAPTLSRVATASGELRDVFAGGQDGVYRDFRLVTIDGKRLVSFIRADTVYVCGGKQALVLATPDGEVVREFGTTDDSYGRAIWSADGSTVAYEAQACLGPDELSDQMKGTDRLASYNGSYVANLSTGQARRVVAGLSSTYSLEAVVPDGVRLASDRMGVVQIEEDRVEESGPVVAESLAQMPDQPVTVARMWAPYINQRWDTRDEFLGLSACGPTSAIMSLAGRDLPERWMWANKTDSPVAPHWTEYGRYVTDVYTFGGETFDRTAQDSDFTGAWSGAYGWMIEPKCKDKYGNLVQCTVWDNLTDFLERHGRGVFHLRATETSGASEWPG